MTDHVSREPSIVIVGAGWAGLSAAVRLSSRRIPITLLEASRYLGGRARRLEIGGQQLDNGQHLLLGAYEETLAMLAVMGVKENKALLRMPLDLTMRTPRHEGINLASLYLPAPLNLLFGLLRANGIPWSGRFGALPGLYRLMHWQGEHDLAVSTLLRRKKLPTQLIDGVLNPLCLAALNTHPDEASSKVFCEVLKGTFATYRRHSDFLIPRVDLSTMFSDPARAYIDRQGGRILTHARVRALEQQGEEGYRILLDDGELKASQVILATPLRTTRMLCATIPALQEWLKGFSLLEEDPICTVYLRYPEKTRIAQPFIGMLDTTSQWLFDRRITGNLGTMAVVISGSGQHMTLDNYSLIKQIQAELKLFYPQWPMPLEAFVVREKRATFRASVDCERLRPLAKTPLPSLWLAGDYTATGMPATLEGAVISGLACADGIISSHG